MIITAPLLDVIRQTGDDVLTLIDGLDEGSFLRSRLTRREAARQLQVMAGVLAGLPPMAREAMPEIDWAGWRAAAAALAGGDADAADEAAWFAARSLVPATLSWLRVYERESPALFTLAP